MQFQNTNLFILSASKEAHFKSIISKLLFFYLTLSSFSIKKYHFFFFSFQLIFVELDENSKIRCLEMIGQEKKKWKLNNKDF